jgi:hypothetical protein
MDRLWIACVIAISAAATLFAWWRISRSADPLAFKVCMALVASIPLLGPVFWLFAVSMPPSHV